MSESADREKPDDDLSERPLSEEQVPQKSSGSCLLYGCLIALVLMIVGTGGILVGGYWFLKGQLTKYTSDQPSDLPTVEYSEEQLENIQSRIDSFKETVEKGSTPPAPLVLTAEEINALIAKDDDLRGRVFVTIQDGQVSGDVSVPTDFLPGGKGRYFNAAATFDVSLDNGVLIVTLAAAEVKGKPVPAEFIQGMSQENLAKELYKDPEAAETIGRFERIEIVGDTIVLTPRAQASGEAPGDEVEPAAEAEPAAESAEQTVPEGAVGAGFPACP